MSQHDFEITAEDTNTGQGYRAAVNAALQALASNNTGSSAPSTPYPNQFFADSDAGYLYMRNDANTAWIVVGTLGNIKTVTNGDDHDHSGGDGAQINHTTLSNIGSKTHSEIDAHITLTTGNPHSVTKTEVGLGNVLDEEQVSKSDYTENSILVANVDSTPITVTIAEQTVVGRKTGGNITALSSSEVYDVISLDSPESNKINGIKIQLTAGEEIPPFALGYVKSDSQIWLANNTPEQTPALYINGEVTITASASGTFLKFGFVNNPDWDLSPGSPVYVSEYDGLITQTMPSGSGQVVQIVGVALNKTIVDFSPIFAYVLLT
jgi:hypothetical protein